MLWHKRESKKKGWLKSNWKEARKGEERRMTKNQKKERHTRLKKRECKALTLVFPPSLRRPSCRTNERKKERKKEWKKERTVNWRNFQWYWLHKPLSGNSLLPSTFPERLRMIVLVFVTQVSVKALRGDSHSHHHCESIAIPGDRRDIRLQNIRIVMPTAKRRCLQLQW